jgi:hypothetical protein
MKTRWLIVLTAVLSPVAIGQEVPVTQPASAPTTSAASQPLGDAPVTQPATTNPTTNPFSRFSSRRDETSRNNGFPVQKLNGTQYASLEQRSIFVKGYFKRSVDDGSEARPPRTDPRPTEVFQPVTPEKNLVFVGATEFDDEYVAFIEDFTGGKVQMLKAGEAVGRGKMGPISLNYMDYVDKTGKTVRVAIGKNLEGVDPPTTRPSFIASSPPSDYSSTTSPSSGGLLSATDSIAERLRRKRAAELGGG